MANQVEIRIQVDDGGSSTATASRFDSALASMTEQQKLSTAEMIKNTHELGMQTQVETELMKAKYLDMFEKVRASGLLTIKEFDLVNTKIAGIKLATNQEQLNNALKGNIPLLQTFGRNTVTADEATSSLFNSFNKAAQGSFQLSSEMGRMESMMMRMAIRAVMMGVAIGTMVNAYKDADMLSADMKKSTEELHTSFIALREETATALAPALEGLNTAAMYALEGMRALIAGYEAGTVNISAMAMKAGIVLKLLPDMMRGNGQEAAKQMTAQMGYVDDAAGTGLDKIYATYMDKGKKLQEAMDAKKGGAGAGGKPDAVDYGIQSEAIAIQKEYNSMIDATMSAEERKAEQLQQFHDRAMVIYGEEEAAVMTLAIRTAEAKEIERKANEKAAQERDKFSTAIYNNFVKEYAATKNIGDAIVAATKTMVADVIKAMGQEEAMKAGRDLWDGFTYLSNPLTAGLAPGKFASSAGHAAMAVAMGAASVAVSGGGGGASAGGASSVAQGGINSAANIPQEQQSTLIVDTKNLDWKERQLAQTIMTQIFDEFQNKGKRFPSNVVIQ